MQLVQVFDSWAGELAPHDYRTFSLPYCQQIASVVRSKLQAEGLPVVPMTLFPKGAMWGIAEFAEKAGYDTLGLDWVISPTVARAMVNGRTALQGNIDPNILYGGREAIEREVKRMCEEFKVDGRTQAWIANLGHGITPGVDPDDLKWLLECVHKYSVSS